MSMQKFGIKSLKQLFTLFLWITFIVVAVFSIFTFAYLYKNIHDVKNSTLNSVCYNAQRIIEERIEAIDSAEAIILLNRDVQEFCFNAGTDKADMFETKASDFIRSTVNVKGNGLGAALFCNKDDISLTSCNFENDEEKFINKSYLKYKENVDNNLFMYRIPDSLFTELYVCHFKPITYQSMQKVESYEVGTLAVFARINTYELERNSEKNALLTVNLRNDVLGESCVLIDTLDKEKKTNSIKLTQRIYFSDWYIYAELFKIEGINFLTPFFLLTVILIMLLVVFVLSFKASVKRMADIPIKKLSTYIEEFVLSNSSRTRTIKTVEVEEFDKILKHINKLFERVSEQARLVVKTQQQMYEKELVANEQALYMNQLQINPHFLFNTLNTITQMCVANGMEEVTDITQNIADIFRYSIEGDYKATIDEEIYIVLKYLKIFNSRYGREFSYELDIDDDLYEYQIMKMMIQPLIENSFKHGGIASKAEPIIKISAYREDEFIIISVMDNGNGIDDEKLKKINGDLASVKTEPNKGIGLLNVNKRLKVCYGNDSGIEVRSCAGEYTEVLIKIKNSDK